MPWYTTFLRGCQVLKENLFHPIFSSSKCCKRIKFPPLISFPPIWAPEELSHFELVFIAHSVNLWNWVYASKKQGQNWINWPFSYYFNSNMNSNSADSSYFKKSIKIVYFMMFISLIQRRVVNKYVHNNVFLNWIMYNT